MGTFARYRLRDNLKRLLDEGVATYTEFVESNAITNGTLGRVIGEDGQNVNLEQLDWLAQAIGVEPWQLLHPDFDAATLSATALKAARKIDSLAEGYREPAYAMFVQQLDFANIPKAVVAASVPDTVRPKRLRRVDR